MELPGPVSYDQNVDLNGPCDLVDDSILFSGKRVLSVNSFFGHHVIQNPVRHIDIVISVSVFKWVQ